MGRYQKKRYKKHSIDPYSHMDIEREYLDALDDHDPLDSEDIFDDHIDSTKLLEEPEIVTQLRQEELEGTLPLWLPDQTNEPETTMKITNRYDQDHINQKDTSAVSSYEQSLQIARKTLQDLLSEE